MAKSNKNDKIAKLINKCIEEFGFSCEKDNYGQIVLYTGMMKDENGNLVEWKGEEDEEQEKVSP